MYQKITSSFTIESLTAIITWALVCGSSLLLMGQSQNFSHYELAITAVLFFIFIVTWKIAIREEEFTHENLTRISLICLQYGVILALFFSVPYSFTAILVTIWSSQIPYYTSINRAIMFSPLWSAPLALIHYFYWDESYIFLSAMLYWTFNLFALVMVNTTIKEQKAREAANELNRDLLATQALLSEATKQAERVRIARNIHDLLGHHLTALTINLQVAARISDGEAKQKIEDCHGLAKLLLSDVREAVSEIREKSNLQLQAALVALIDNVPEMEVSLDYDERLQISDVNVANTILCCVQECITNSLKHSNASHFNIQLRERDKKIQLSIQDNGKQANGIKAGNGITGMRERVAELGGKMEFSSLNHGFEMQIELPELV